MVEAQSSPNRAIWKAPARVPKRRGTPVLCSASLAPGACSLGTGALRWPLAREIASSACRASASLPDWWRYAGLSGTALQARSSSAAGAASASRKMRHMPSVLGRAMEITTARTWPDAKKTCMRTMQESLADGGRCSVKSVMATGRMPPAPTLVTTRSRSSEWKFPAAAEATPPTAVSASVARKAGRRPNLSARLPKHRAPTTEAMDLADCSSPQCCVVVPHTSSSVT
mmetsp:Transcript_28825/g.82564  ORF Transcript_28825/g.82564 Transcript_28825/m.82564 type:complete len:228 (-) Transcript_28825:284-967(-)